MQDKLVGEVEGGRVGQGVDIAVIGADGGDEISDGDGGVVGGRNGQGRGVWQGRVAGEDDAADKDVTEEDVVDEDLVIGEE